MENLLDQIPFDYYLLVGKHVNGYGYHASIVRDSDLQPEGWADTSHGLTLEVTIKRALNRFNNQPETIYSPEYFGINLPGDTHEQTL